MSKTLSVFLIICIYAVGVIPFLLGALFEFFALPFATGQRAYRVEVGSLFFGDLADRAKTREESEDSK
jgi:hypothetical protein